MGDTRTVASPEQPSSHSRNILTAVIGNGAPAAAAFLTGPVLARALGVDDRGAVAAATSVLTLVTTIAAAGIPEAVSFAVARHPRLVRAAAARASLMTLFAGLLGTAVVLIAAPALADGRDEVAFLIDLAAIAVVPILLVGILRGVASAQHRWRLVTAEKITGATLRLVVLLPFWLTGTLSPWIAVVSFAAAPLMGGMVYLRILAGSPKTDGELAPPATMRGMAGFGGRMWLGSLSGVLFSRLDQALMTPLAGTYQLGLYVVAASISELPLIVNTAVRDVTFIADASETVDERLGRSARASFLVCLLIGIAIGITMIWLIPLLFGSAFAGAIPITAVLLVSVVAGTPGSVAGAGLTGRGRPGLRSIALAIAAVLNIVLLVVLTPPFGGIGAALATLGGGVVGANLNVLFLWRYFGIRPGQFYGVRRSDVRMLVSFGMRTLRRG